jgi:cob(I)alamin adenosyltransferase
VVPPVDGFSPIIAPFVNLVIMPAMARYYTGTGDDGTTGLLGEGRVPKHHSRPEAYGAVEEASAALGLARAAAGDPETAAVILEIQRDLYHLMAELAATREEAPRFRRIDAARVAFLEGRIEAFGARVEMPGEFIVPGDSGPGAALDLARTIVRRAERRVSRLQDEGELENPQLLRYLNRLSSLCFLLELWEGRRAGVDRPTPAKAPPA